MMISILLPFIIALGSGCLGALLGMGGGKFMIPLLVLFLDIPLHIAAGASILSVVATSSAAAAVYTNDEITNMRLGMFLELATTLGAVTGAFLTTRIDEGILKIVLGLSLMYASVDMLQQARKTGNSWEPKPNDWLADKLDLDGSYHDAAREEDVSYGVDRTPQTFGVSYGAGILSGLLGIGGGGIKVPAMHIVGKVPMKAAVATSSFMIGVTASASALVYVRNGFCDAFITAPVVLGTLVGSFIGANLTRRLKGDLLKKAFIVILGILGVRMILSGVGF